MKKFNIGDYVIVNSMDRPCANHVAIVEDINIDGCPVCSYISGYLSGWGKMPCPPENVTLVSDFGIGLKFANRYSYTAFKDPTKTACATYGDGKSRTWQDDDCGKYGNVQPVAKQFWSDDLPDL